MMRICSDFVRDQAVPVSRVLGVLIDAADADQVARVLPAHRPLADGGERHDPPGNGNRGPAGL